MFRRRTASHPAAVFHHALPVGVMLAALGSMALTGCGTGSDPASAKSPVAGVAAAPVTMTDPWVKAAATGMTGVFGTLANTTDQPVTVVSAVSSAARRIELHEVAGTAGDLRMRPKEGGFAIPAKGGHRLQPGGDHLMLMGLTAPLKPGSEITVMLALRDGRTVPFTAVVKEFAGGKENYQPGGGGPAPSMSPGGAHGAGGAGGMHQSHG